MLSSIFIARRRIKGRRKTSKNGPTSAAVGNQFNSRLMVANLFSYIEPLKLKVMIRKRELKSIKYYLGKLAEGNWNFVFFVKNDHLVEDVDGIKQRSHRAVRRVIDFL